MGLTEPFMVTVEGQKIWTASCEREISARFNWNEKWGWMPSVIAENSKKLRDLKAKHNARVQGKEISPTKTPAKDPRPLPNSTNHENCFSMYAQYGWLVTKPEYQIERFGPFPLTMKIRVEPTLQDIERQVADDAERVRGKESRSDANVKYQGANAIGSGERNTQNQIGQSAEESHPERVENNNCTVSPVVHQIAEDPGHVQSDGGKVKLCCCTAQCSCKHPMSGNIKE